MAINFQITIPDEGSPSELEKSVLRSLAGDAVSATTVTINNSGTESKTLEEPAPAAKTAGRKRRSPAQKKADDEAEAAAKEAAKTDEAPAIDAVATPEPAPAEETAPETEEAPAEPEKTEAPEEPAQEAESDSSADEVPTQDDVLAVAKAALKAKRHTEVKEYLQGKGAAKVSELAPADRQGFIDAFKS